MKVLVTGGAGYIGSLTCKVLAANGFQPVVYDNLSRGHRAFVKWGDFEQGDIRDGDRIVEVLRKHGCQAVIHFAALAYVGESVEAPDLYYSNNVVGSLTLLDSLRATGVNFIVFSSSCATYGIPDKLPITENQPQNPINPYGFTKLAIERALADCSRGWGLRHVSLRYFNACGADPDLEVGELHDPETHILPRVIQAAFGQRERIQVMGGDYPTKDGTCIRDYIHVQDLAVAHVRALERLTKGRLNSKALNLGCGRGYSVMDIIGAVGQRHKGPVPYEIVNRRPGDPPELVANAGLAEIELDWRPQFSDLKTIVDTAYRWHQGVATPG